MVCIFSQVTAELSHESVSCNLDSKKLQNVSQESGVKLISYADSFSMVGDWNSINAAYIKLTELISSFNNLSSAGVQVDDTSPDASSDVNDDDDGDLEEIQAKQNTYSSTLSNITFQTSRIVGQQMKKIIPEPMVVYLKDFTNDPEKDEANEMHVHSEVKNEADSENKDFIESMLAEPSSKKRIRNKSRRKSTPPERLTSIKQTRSKTLADKITNNKTKPISDKNLTSDEPQVSFKKRILSKMEKSLDKESESEFESSVEEKEDDSGESTDEYELPNVQKTKKRKYDNEDQIVKSERKYCFKTCVKIVKSGKSPDKSNFQCSECNYVTPKKGNLREHWQRNHAGGKYPCTECDKVFGIRKDLTRHLKRHFEAEHCCQVCGKFYKSRRTLTEHEQKHQDGYEKPEFACEKCNKKFSTKYVLSYHVQSEHLGMRKSFVCVTCGKSFTQKGTYLQHANIHLGIKPYVCDVCGIAFRYEKSLKEHKYRHDDFRRFSCIECGKRFTQSSALHIHLKVHKEHKDYLCQTCGKGFTQRQALTRHERIHNGEKPFACRLCSRRFNDASIIRRHMILLHKKDPKQWRVDVISKYSPAEENILVSQESAKTNESNTEIEEKITEVLSKNLPFHEITRTPERNNTDGRTFQTESMQDVNSSQHNIHNTNTISQPMDVYDQNVTIMYSEMSGNRNTSSGNTQMSPYNLIDGQEFHRINPWSGGHSSSLYPPENVMYLQPNYQNYQNSN